MLDLKIFLRGAEEKGAFSSVFIGHSGNEDPGYHFSLWFFRL